MDNRILLGIALVVLFVWILWLIFRSKTETISARHVMDFTSTNTDWTTSIPPSYDGWTTYYTFDYNYRLEKNKTYRIVGDAALPDGTTYALLTIPSVGSCKEWDRITVTIETVATPDNIYFYVFEDSAEPSPFSQVWAYTEPSNDNLAISLEVIIVDGVKRWAMFGGYTDL